MERNDVLVSRRDFLSAASAVTTGIMAVPAAATPGEKLKVLLAGTGSRGTSLWGKHVVDNFSDVVEFVGFFDINPARLEYAKRYLGVNPPVYTDFDKAVNETKPDAVIVTTMCSTHEQYIVRAMELGCDVITEKPMAVDEQQCQRILDAEKRTGRHITVTFNYRYGPDATAAKEILASGEIGEVTSVDWHWWLNNQHGADYFRRWHAYRKYAGSLWVHKATHHFDLMNWWLDAEPVEVFAKSELRKYGRNGAFRGESCRTCPHKSRCDYYWDMTRNKRYMDLYAGAAQEADGYIRDACVFRQDIDIWDTMVSTVEYNTGVIMSYSLNAFMPYEGAIVGFNGTKGRLDMTIFHKQPWEEKRLAQIRVTQNFKQSYVKDIFAGTSSHGGADMPMQDTIFRGAENYLNRTAGSRAGAMSILTGVAAYHSTDKKRPIKISELVRL